MRKIYFIICLMLVSVLLPAQDYEITFNAVGEGNSLDSVLVQNITQETQLLIPGDAVLHLVGVVTNSIIPSVFNNNLQLFPNPMKEFAMFDVVIVEAERINIEIFDITGKLITSFNQYSECGRHQFIIKGLTAGIYTVNVSCDGWRGSANLVSIGVDNENPTVEKVGQESIIETTIKRITLNQEYQMQYNDGDVLVFTGYSGINSTVSTLIPTESQAVTQNIVSCVDPDGYSYSTVTIGEQIWMAENLRYLPSVNHHQNSSSIETYYYVYNYDGSSVTSAKNTEQYQLYGALYNRPAALISCPTGWHLPSHFDWVELERAVCVSQNCESDYPYTYDAPINQDAIEGSILAGDQDLWQSDYYIPGVYNEPLFSTSGFLARPAGYSQVINEGFFDMGAVAKYWASDVEGANGFVRYIHICNKGVYRDVTNGATGNSVRCVRNVDDEIVIPTVCTQIVTSLTETSAVSGGVVTNNGLGTIQSQGIVWSTMPNPGLDSNMGITDEGNSTGDFISEMNNLISGTVYYVRAYAINSAGAGYGEQVVFETLSESSSNNGQPCPGLTSVYYDGYSYPTIQFGDRCWLAENLKYLPSINEPDQQSTTLPRYYVYDYYGTDIFEAQMSENYETYGVLYNFPAAKTACPNGWYLPYSNDWTDLEREVCITGNCDLEFLYGDENFFTYEGTYEGSRLAGNSDLWIHHELTNNTEFGQSGFDVLPAGALFFLDEWTYSFTNILCQGILWTGTELDENYSVIRAIVCYLTNIEKSVSFKDQALSVRCLKAEVPKIETSSVDNILHHFASSGGTIISDCGSTISQKGVVWGTATDPSLEQNIGFTIDGQGIDGFESTVNGLEAETTYFLRAYATNSIGTGYGQVEMFTTSDISVPIVETDSATSITYESALSGGILISDGGVSLTSFGMVWDTLPLPTVDVNSGAYLADLDQNSFSEYLQNLDYSKTYYVRAFATNSIGTGYGNQIEFTTDEFFPFINCGDNFYYQNYYYKTVQIGNQCWFAENMRYDNGCSQIAWVNNTDVGQCSFIDDNEEEFGHVGMFYQWSVAKDICPIGWHLPTDEEWTTLDNFVHSQEEYWCSYGGNGYAKALADSVGWKSYSYSCNVGNEPALNNATGFSAKPTSYYYFNGLTGENTLFWTSTSGTNSASDKSYKWEIQYNLNFMTHAVLYKYEKLPVRCLKAELPEIHTSTVSIISETTATIECNVVSDGGEFVTARGCVWSTATNPTIANNDGITIDGAGLGDFSSVIKWLSPNTEYYVRAYATNPAGTAYGEELVFTTKSLNPPCPGFESIFYQGHSYNTVQIGSQCWFAENLRYLPSVNSLTSTSTTVPYYYVYMYNGTDFSEATLTSEFNNFGVLYNWTAAKTACPEGWSLPSHYDWTILERNLCSYGTCDTDFPYYNQTEQTGLRGHNEGSKIIDPELWTPADLTDTYDAGISNFDALPAGAKLASSFLVQYGGEQTYWWTSTQSSTSNAWHRSLDFLYPGTYRNTSSKAYAYSVRCFKTNDVYGILPSVITHDVENLTPISAKLIAEVENSGQSVVGARGILWGTNPQMDYDTYQNRVFISEGLGDYFLQLNALSPGSTYYYRAFAMTEQGIGYGEVVEFTTLDLPEPQPCSETPTVDYEGYSYKTVKIGNQCWFAENLKYLPNVIENSTISLTIPYCYVFGYNGTDVNEAVLTDNYNTYGVLYNWAAIMNGENGSANNPSNVKGICPDGWHLPSKLEFEQLATYLINNGYAYTGIVGETVIAKSMADTLLWSSSTVIGAIGNNLLANNSSGFSALPSGTINLGYGSIPYTAHFWTSTVQGTSTSSYEYYMAHFGSSSTVATNLKSVGNSVRCIRDYVAPEVSTIGVSEVSYTTAVVDGQVISGGELPVLARGVVWSRTSNPTLAVSEGFSVNGTGIGEFSGQMHHLTSDTLYYVRAYARNSADTIYGEEISVETLAFPNCGTVDYQGYSYKTVIIGERCWLAENMRYLPTVVPASTSSTTVPYYYVYGYNGTNVADAKATSNYQNYGVLYNWIAAAMVCPPGWNLPSHYDWTYLERTICGGIENNSIFPFDNTTTIDVTNNAGSGMAGSSSMWTDGALENNQLFGASGFNALPAGKRETTNYFDMINNNAFFWSSSPINSSYWYRWIGYQDSSACRSGYYANRGYSVRCVQSAVLPNVETVSASEISDTSANISLNIISDGGMYVSLYGLVWDTVPNPTITNCQNYIQLNGPAIGMKEIHLNNLIPDKTIYIKSYAINSIGTSYGNEINFVTLSPTVFTQCGDDIFYLDQYYHTVQIGDQCWFAENLRYLPSVTSVNENSSTEPLYYIYGYTGNSISEAKQRLFSSNNIYKIYGVLYNWTAAMNGYSPAEPESNGVRGICPSGWLVPSEKSWIDLENYLVETGYDCPWDDYDNGISKSISDSLYWTSTSSQVCSPGRDDLPNNETGFSGRPGGSTESASMGGNGFWWTSEDAFDVRARIIQINNQSSTLTHGQHYKYAGNSIRCLME